MRNVSEKNFDCSRKDREMADYIDFRFKQPRTSYAQAQIHVAAAIHKVFLI